MGTTRRGPAARLNPLLSPGRQERRVGRRDLPLRFAMRSGMAAAGKGHRMGLSSACGLEFVAEVSRRIQAARRESA